MSPFPPRQRGAPYVRLRPTVAVVRTASRLALIGDAVWVYPDPPDELGAAIEQLRTAAGVRMDQLEALLGADDADELCRAIYEHGFLQVGDAPFPPGTESPCRAYFEAALDTVQPGIAACSFVLVGCGGIGCEVARHLVASGAGALTLIDFDTVARSNLNRQYLFSLDDLGRPKVEAARAALLELSRDTRIAAVSARIERVEDLDALALAPATAVLCCADTPRDTIGTVVHRYARSRGSWFGICGVGLLSGFWGPILAPGSAQVYRDVLALQGEEELLPAVAQVYRDVLALQGEEELLPAVAPTGASFGPTNSLVAAAFTRDVVHALLGDRPGSLDHRVELDFRSFERTRTSWADLAAAAGS